MSKDFDNLVRRATCQMRVMLRERRRFRVLAKELETFLGQRLKVHRDQHGKQLNLSIPG